MKLRYISVSINISPCVSFFLVAVCVCVCVWEAGIMEKMALDQNWELLVPAQPGEEENSLFLVRKSRNGPQMELQDDTETPDPQIAALGYDDVVGNNQVSKGRNGHQIVAPQNDDVHEQEQEELVYHDKVEGAWKCRICPWTYQIGSVHVDHIPNHTQHSHNLVNVETLNFECEGIESAAALKDAYKVGVSNGVLSSSSSVASQLSFQENNARSSKEMGRAEGGLMVGDDLEVTQFDVERVIQKQETHDFYCPNCNSCITKRVILRKRKRVIQISDEEVKKVKEAAVAYSLGSESIESGGDNDAQLTTETENERDDGPAIFRCLSCFRFFIPTGSRRVFGTKNERENLQNEQAPTIKRNWFNSMFTPNKQELAVQQGTVATDVNNGLLEGAGEILHGPSLNSSSDDDIHVKAKERLEEVCPCEVPQQSFPQTKDEISSCKPGKIDTVAFESIAPGKDTVIIVDDAQPGESSQIVEEDQINPVDTAGALHEKVRQTEERAEFNIEVVKSIVYGGLAESITSLSVVSSAAGGGAATLNVLALGMANLIGGLFVICNNIWELRRDECPEQVADQTSSNEVHRDRYRELLGCRQNFILHAVVTIVSYLAFGLVPPLVYGFSFRKTDDKQMKLVAVAATSLVCIVVLAVGKTYVQRPPNSKPYLKSVTSYVALGVMASGVSYAAGELVERLLQKLGLFQSPVSPNFQARLETEGLGIATESSARTSY